ncbi:MAG: type II toxin-antitoxin system death-on-curing family toxin [Chloroflexi bacterium]|nr:type II toxin-antitoxin system death-on-curing family toxin [Chloroflexota bacterium]
MTDYLELADYLLIAERVLGLPAEVIANFNRIGLADSALAAPQAGFGDVEAYPDFATKAAVLCWHLVKNHPLADGNKRCAFLATVEFVERNGRTWIPAPGDPDETDRVIRAVASGDLSERDFRDWIAERCG